MSDNKYSIIGLKANPVGWVKARDALDESQPAMASAYDPETNQALARQAALDNSSDKLAAVAKTLEELATNFATWRLGFDQRLTVTKRKTDENRQHLRELETLVL